MKIDIKVIPCAKRNLIKEGPLGLRVYLTAPAVDGKANKALQQVLSKHFKVRKQDIQITKGLKSRHKTIKIEGL